MYRNVAALVVCLAIASVARADLIYDSAGFEGFAEGVLNGQDGWEGGWFALDPFVGVDPFIEDFGPSLGGKSLVMDGAVAGGSFAYREFPELVGAGYQEITVSFDIWRPSSDAMSSHFSWSGFTEPEPGMGRQSSIPFDPDTNTPAQYLIFPFGEDDPFVPDVVHPSAEIVFDRWANLTMTWDMDVGQATAWYDGMIVGSMSIGPDVEIGDWGFFLNGDSAHACIDNFVISASVPEPTSAVLTFIALCAPLWKRNTRRKSISNRDG